MGLLSSIATKLKVPVVLQVLLLVVVGFFYLSSQNEVRSRREQAKEMGMIVGRLQSLGVDIQLLLHGQGDLQKVEAELGAQSAQIKKLPFGGRLASPLTGIKAVLQDTSKLFRRNLDIEKEIFQLTALSIEQSDRFIADTSAKLADPGRERSISRLERLVLAGASVNSGTNHHIRTLFLRIKTDSSKRKELIAYLDTAISNVTESRRQLTGTPFMGAAQKALEANHRMRQLALEYQANCDKIALASAEIEKQSSVMREELDSFAAKSMLAGYDFSQVRMMTLLLVISIAAIILAVLTWSLSRSILRPIREMTAVLSNIAQGEGDLTQRLPVNSKDEIGEVCGLFNTFIDKLHGIIGQVAKTATQVASSSGVLFATSGQQAAATEEMAAKAGTLATASEEMAATISGIAQNCNLAAEHSQLANSAAAAGAQVVESTISGMARIADNTRLSASTVSALGARSEQIGEIVATIEDIADQTNLLALNAAIEAARAGEQGRGFAVVADEVRALAERTTNATREIGEMIKSIQGETRKAVAVMEEGVSEVDKGTAAAAQSDSALKEIIERMNELSMQVSQVATAAEQQSYTTTEISNNIVQMTQVINQSSRGAQESAAATSQLSGFADNLQSLMGQFRL
ncbi:methyl-accepting chemotaxis protein [Geotalea toluenoxydans]